MRALLCVSGEGFAGATTLDLDALRALGPTSVNSKELALRYTGARLRGSKLSVKQEPRNGACPPNR